MIVEADDGESRSAVARQADNGCFEVIVVPPGGPRTKPKALTYALSFARGDLVTVFDAEDRPEPGQLRRAAAAFHQRPELGCVQARLAPDNEGSWFARMFAVEYAANFEVLLPALSDWDVPLPLGGTSNHFPRAVLERVGAWDPFNVTEDADLGVRLARFGYPCATISAHTYEEAPVSFRQWLPQRRRWIKGWIQTAVLCARRAGVPRSLRLPIRQQLAVHGIITAGVVGLLLYPVSLLIIATAVIAAVNGSWPMDTFSRCLLALNFANLIAILIASAVSGYRGLKSAGTLRLAWHIPLLPAYWALMSVAAWQALIRYFRNPAEWEKTAHGLAKDRRPHGKRAVERRDYRKQTFGQTRQWWRPSIASSETGR
jgi:cellulose synthase/poly-beta-1,6-N-acetylglucosamine synthase-like glycosyltransferase